jgi:hypothetical protein
LISIQRKPSYRRNTSSPKTEEYGTDYLDAFQENSAKYVDAEQEVEKRQYELKERVEALRSEPDSPLNERTESLNKNSDAGTNNEKGKSANQGEL